MQEETERQASCDTREEVIGHPAAFIAAEALLPFYLVLQPSSPLTARVTQSNSILR